MNALPNYKAVNLLKAIQAKQLARSNNTTLVTSSDDYDIQHFIPDPEDVFKQSAECFAEIQSLLSAVNDPVYEEHLLDTMVTMIWASNRLEKAGSSLEVTRKICHEILVGREVKELDDEDSMCQEIRDNLTEQQTNDYISHDSILRAWKQIVQHAYALKYLCCRMVLDDEPLFEEMIKETHEILTHGIDADNEQRDESETYSGIYRTSSVGRALVVFPDPEDIPKRVTEAVAAFNVEVEEAEIKKSVDPYTLASKLFHTILNIHPFLDGNSRTSRLLLNAVLLKYLGIVIPVSRDETEAAMFKEVATRAMENEFTDEEHRCSDKPPFAIVNTYVAIQGKSMLLDLKDRLTAKKHALSFKQEPIVGYPWKPLEEEKEEVDDCKKECYWDDDRRDENDPP